MRLSQNQTVFADGTPAGSTRPSNMTSRNDSWRCRRGPLGRWVGWRCSRSPMLRRESVTKRGEVTYGTVDGDGDRRDPTVERWVRMGSDAVPISSRRDASRLATDRGSTHPPPAGMGRIDWSRPTRAPLPARSSSALGASGLGSGRASIAVLDGFCSRRSLSSLWPFAKVNMVAAPIHHWIDRSTRGA